MMPEELACWGLLCLDGSRCSITALRLTSHSQGLLKQRQLKQGEGAGLESWGLSVLQGAQTCICSSVVRTYARLALVLLLHCVQQQADC